VLPAVLEALRSLDLEAMVATAGARVEAPGRSGNIWLVDFLPGEQAAARSSIVICNGGSPTCYQALAAGVPVVGIPSNLDQYLNMSLLARDGVGILVRAGKATAPVVTRAIAAVLETAQFAHRARSIQLAINSHPATEVFTNFVDEIVMRSHA
jgi:UDP:flavonoid glycosyltransferase YjiC (YdhE family)